MTKTTLVVHPGNDPSTRFLEPIYERLDAEVVRGSVSRRDLLSLASRADRILMCGHGCQLGLFGGGEFRDYLVIDHSWADLLKEKEELLGIWCYASRYFRDHELRGWASEMFVSEKAEAEMFLDVPFTESDIDDSNHAFAEIIGRSIHLPLPALHESVRKDYGRIARANAVARFNHARLELIGEPPMRSHEGCLTSANPCPRDLYTAGGEL